MPARKRQRLLVNATPRVPIADICWELGDLICAKPVLSTFAVCAPTSQALQWLGLREFWLDRSWHVYGSYISIPFWAPAWVVEVRDSERRRARRKVVQLAAEKKGPPQHEQLEPGPCQAEQASPPPTKLEGPNDCRTRQVGSLDRFRQRRDDDQETGSLLLRLGTRNISFSVCCGGRGLLMAFPFHDRLATFLGCQRVSIS